MLAFLIGVYEGMFDCSDLAQYGISSSGVYALLSDDTSHPLSGKDVYCDMETERGGYNHRRPERRDMLFTCKIS